MLSRWNPFRSKIRPTPPSATPVLITHGLNYHNVHVAVYPLHEFAIMGMAAPDFDVVDKNNIRVYLHKSARVIIYAPCATILPLAPGFVEYAEDVILEKTKKKEA